MNISRSVFPKNQYIVNHSAKNNIKTNNKLASLTPNYSNVSVENYKANYMVNFKGGMSYEKSHASGIGTLNHQTAFFREPVTDEIVQNYIIENFGDDKEINIVSGACSTGEEAKSYAMLLDSLHSRLKIQGFDISSEIVKEAQNNTCEVIMYDGNSETDIGTLNSENILLTDDIDNLTEYERKCRNKFRQYYKQKDLPYEVPVFPEAKMALKDLDALLADKEEFEKQKIQYNEQMQIVKNMSPELAGYMSNVTFEDSINMSKRALKQQADLYKTVVDFEAGNNVFDNCTFVCGDIMNLDYLYEPNSINVLLYRNALYHTLCQGNNMFRTMKDDAPETMETIAKQINKILKMNGLVVFGEEEWMQGIDTKVIKRIMKNNGFELFQVHNENDHKNIWVKVQDI